MSFRHFPFPAFYLSSCLFGSPFPAEVIPVVDVPKRELSQCVAKLKLAMGQPVTFTHAYDLVVRTNPRRAFRTHHIRFAWNRPSP